jgi:hypothetical protein
MSGKIEKVLMRRVGGKNHEVNVGDVVVTEKGKRFYVTGWDDIQNFVHGTSMCEYKYFASAPAEAFGCYFAEAG